jgi:membrane-associated phospholipid phosphatase
VANIVADCDLGVAPPPYSVEPGSEFYMQAREVYDTNLNLTADQIAIARFWSDDPGATATPPGHTISIVTQVLRQQGTTLDVAAEAYAKVGIAISDAFVSCWEGKYRFNLLRPVTYIESMFDQTWMPLLVTPPFPEYASGHSTQSGAGAVVLTDMFGTLAFTDHTHDVRGLPSRSFDSFAAAADEAAISRLYGGIHYRAAIQDGLVMGRCVGDAVNRLPFHK